MKELPMFLPEKKKAFCFPMLLLNKESSYSQIVKVIIYLITYRGNDVIENVASKLMPLF